MLFIETACQPSWFIDFCLMFFYALLFAYLPAGMLVCLIVNIYENTGINIQIWPHDDYWL